jgi:hypothetical protein
MNSSSFTFVIMTRDRPRMLRHSLASLSFQCHGKYRVILSDNSTSSANISANKSLCNQCNAEYIKQSNLSLCSHYDVLLKSLDTNFVTILHDDDIVLPGFVDSIANVVALDTSIAVLGINGFHFTESLSASDRLGSITCVGFRHLRISDDVTIRTPTELLLQWISPFSRGISPVSGCTFNTRLYDPDYFNYYSNTGLYYDTILMLLLLKKGHIKWLGRSCLLMVREHPGRLTHVASHHDERMFTSAVHHLYKKSSKVKLMLNFYIYSRLNSRSRASKARLSLADTLRYYFYLIRCFLQWPLRVPSLLLSKFCNLSTSGPWCVRQP